MKWHQPHHCSLGRFFSDCASQMKPPTARGRVTPSVMETGWQCVRVHVSRASVWKLKLPVHSRRRRYLCVQRSAAAGGHCSAVSAAMETAADLAFFTRDPSHARRWKETQRVQAPSAFFQVRAHARTRESRTLSRCTQTAADRRRSSVCVCLSAAGVRPASALGHTVSAVSAWRSQWQWRWQWQCECADALPAAELGRSLFAAAAGRVARRHRHPPRRLGTLRAACARRCRHHVARIR